MAACAQPHRRERARDGRVLDRHGQPRRKGERLTQRHVPPSKLRREEDAARLLIDHAGYDEPDPLTADRIGDLRQQSAHMLCEPHHEGRGVGDRVVRQAKQGHTAEIGQHEERATEPHIHADHEPITRAHIQHLRAAPARRLCRVAFEDRGFGKELVHQSRHHPTADLHTARQIRPRDRLVLANQIEHDLAVDVPRGGAGRPHELTGIDLSHVRNLEGCAGMSSGAAVYCFSSGGTVASGLILFGVRTN
jgi:hypothetical protein